MIVGFATNIDTDVMQDEIIVEKVLNLHQNDADENSIKLSWSESSGANIYTIYKYNSKSKKYENIQSVDSTSYTVTKLSSSTEYRFYVVASYIDENYKTYDGERSDVFKGHTAPKAPKNLCSYDIGYDYISLQWNSVDGAKGYLVYLYDNNDDKFVRVKSTQNTYCTINELDKNSIYNFRVRAYYKNDNLTAVSKYSDDLLEFTDTTSKPRTNGQIAKIYNKAINDTKTRSSVSVSYKKEIKTKAESTSKTSLLRTLNNILNMFNGTKKSNYKFSNGRSNGVTLNSIIEPYNKKASIRANDIKSFSLDRNNGIYDLNIVLKSDKAKFNGKTKELSTADITDRVYKQVNITTEKITPLKLLSGTQNYNNNSIYIKYDNNNGTLKELKMNIKSDVEAKCKVSSLKFDAKASYTVKETYIFS